MDTRIMPTLENVLLQLNLSTNEWVPYTPFISPASVLVVELVCVLSSLHRALRNSDFIVPFATPLKNSTKPIFPRT